MSEQTHKEFGKIRSFLWPVHNHELKKILPMFLIFFCISFNYTVLRDTKDTLVVTGSGAETIPFLKVYGVVPAAILFMLLYSKLSNMLSKENLFYATIAPFLVFFGLFASVFYPFRESLHPVAFCDMLSQILPVGFAGLIGCVRNWTFSLFYILSELWGSVVLSLLFWGFANDIMRVSEAKRIYSLFALGANAALLVSGPCIYYFSKMTQSLPAGIDPWQVTLNYLMTMVFINGLAIVGTYYWMQRSVLTDKRFFNPEEQLGSKKKSKPKMSIGESLKFLAQSKYILCLAVLVMSYGVCINLVEVTWKGQLKLQYPDFNSYSAFMGMFSTVTGFITICMVFIGGYVIRARGWGFAAAATPVVLLVTGAAFFTFVLFREQMFMYIAALGTTPLFLAVLIGAAQNIMSKSTKYTLFDPTKEMAYIPLDQESKVKGKAAIDVVGARLGKSGGSLVQQLLLITFGSLAAITPYIAIVMFAMIAVWLYSVRSLNKQFVELTGSPDEKKKDQPAPANA